MTGKDIFQNITADRTEYSQLIIFLYINMGEDLYPLLEKADAEGKQLRYDESKVPEGILDFFDEDLISIG